MYRLYFRKVRRSMVAIFTLFTLHACVGDGELLQAHHHSQEPSSTDQPDGTVVTISYQSDDDVPVRGRLLGGMERSGGGEISAPRLSQGAANTSERDRGHSLVVVSTLLPEIKSTEQLVRQLNSADNKPHQEALLRLLRQYNMLFESQPISWFKAEDILEYSTLARIKATDKDRLELLQRYVDMWRKRIQEGYTKKNITRGIEAFLREIDVRVFAGDPTLLVDLGQALLSSLPKSKDLYTQDTYASHSNTIQALHHTLHKIRAISADCWNPGDKQGLYRQLQERLAIVAQSRYYPFQYQSRIVEQSLIRLAQKPKKWEEAGQAAERFYSGF
ncbi:MAG: hypothetical protein AAF706_03710, partial [Bacteroidota bacterium]